MNCLDLSRFFRGNGLLSLTDERVDLFDHVRGLVGHSEVANALEKKGIGLICLLKFDSYGLDPSVYSFHLNNLMASFNYVICEFVNVGMRILTHIHTLL